MSLAWSFYISTVLVYLGVDVMACWGLNLQYGYTGILNFSFIIYQSAGAYVAAVLTLGPTKCGEIALGRDKANSGNDRQQSE